MIELLKKTLIYGIGNIGSKLIMFILVPWYTFYLSSQELGSYDLIWSSINLAIPIFTIQLQDGAFRWLLDRFSADKGVIITSSVYGISLLFIFSLVLGSFTFLLIRLNISGTIWVLSFSLVYAIGIFTYLMQVSRGLGYTLLYALSGFGMTLILLICNFLIIHFGKLSLEMILLSNLVAHLIVSLIIAVRIRIFTIVQSNKFSYLVLWDLVKYSFPLVPNTISWWVINSSSKFILFYFYGAALNGIYAVATKFATVLFLFNGIFNLAWQEFHISKKTNDRDFSRLFNFYLLFEAFVISVIIIWIKTLVRIIVSEDYYDAVEYVPLLLLGVGFQAIASFVGVNFMKLKSTSVIMKSSLISAIVSVVISLVLVPELGMLGTALSTMIGMSCLFIYRFIFLIRDVKFQYDLLTILLSLFSLMIAFGLFYLEFEWKGLNVLSTVLLFVFLLFGLKFSNFKYEVRII